MQNKIDYAKLLGFAAVSDQLSGDVDFQDETISAKLGAKAGEPDAPSSAIDYTKLLGFGAVSDRLSDGIDLKDETISAKLGAKAGEPVAPMKASEGSADGN
jgi:hypothetical protein